MTISNGKDPFPFQLPSAYYWGNALKPLRKEDKFAYTANIHSPGGRMEDPGMILREKLFAN
jgi:hypothetical protein